MKLSVIVPIYNERYLVGELLRQVLAQTVPGIDELEIIAVDDGSSDGSSKILKEILGRHPDRIKLLCHEANRGKGAALRTGIDSATGDLIVFQDADLEYDPQDLGKLVTPFSEDGADVVFGSRFLSGSRRRVLYFRHSLGNRLLTFLSNWFTDLNLSDVETGYKMFRGPLLKSIPIRSNDFRVEIELTAKVAKRNSRIFEVPISYRGRTYREGKKVSWKDGVRALTAILKFWLVDDLYKEDEYGAEVLHALERAQRFNHWMADVVRPWLGNRVLEIGAGIGNLTTRLVPRDVYVASDYNASYVAYLQNLASGKPYLTAAHIDLEDAASFAECQGRFDTVICINVLEHVGDPLEALRSMYGALEPEGRLVLYVPAGQALFSSLDEALGHRCRYDRRMLAQELSNTGFELEHMSWFNRTSVPTWWWNGKVFKARKFNRVQLKAFDLLIPIVRRVDRFLPWPGLGLIAVARRPSRPG